MQLAIALLPLCLFAFWLILFLIYIRYLFSKIRAKFENLQSLSYIDDVMLYIEGRNIDKNVKILKNAAKIAFT